MQIVVDGIIFELNPVGGVSRMFSEILPRMCLLDESVEIELLTNRRGGYGLEPHPRLRSVLLNPPIDRILRPRRLFQPLISRMAEIVKQRATYNLKRSIWHPTYYTLLPNWRGPVVVTVYDMLYELFPQHFDGLDDHYFRRKKAECVQKADAIISISKTTAQELQARCHVAPGKIHVIPLAHSAVFQVLTDAPPAPMRTPYLLYVGGRRSYKNFDLLLRAYSQWKQRKDVSLVVVGKAWSQQEQQAVADFNLQGRVQHIPAPDDSALAQFYNHASAFIYPSLYEGFGIPLLEAAACGCPVVASDIPSSREVLGDIPIYFDANSADSLIDALDHVMLEGRDSERVRRGLLHVQQYSWDRCAHQTLQVYKKLTNI